VVLPVEEGVALTIPSISIIRSRRESASGKRLRIFSPSTTTWPTWMPWGPYSFAIAWARVHRPALAELKAPYPARPRSEAPAPVTRKERGHVRLLGRVRDEGRSFASGSLDVRDDGIQRRRRASGRDDLQSLLGEALAELRAQPPIRADR
jgi:hypothetical protein